MERCIDTVQTHRTINHLRLLSKDKKIRMRRKQIVCEEGDRVG